MRSLLGNGAASACEAARLRASLALDGELDELHLLLLQRHLDRCPECAALVPQMRAVTVAVRRAPAERRPSGRVTMRRPARRLPWASIVVSVATLAVGALTLPQLSTSTGAHDEPSRLAARPLRLPIGQRSALDDFLGSYRVPAREAGASHGST